MAKDKPVLKSDNIQRKEYNYTFGNISLKFTLRTDVKAELKPFRDLLKQAQEDVEADIAALDKNKL